MQKTVFLYLASNSTFYKNLYFQIEKGFRQAGLKIIGGPSLLNSNELNKKIEKYKPYFVFEMNRTKNEIENFPEEVRHICWLVDFWGRSPEDIRGSDILYCWANFWLGCYFRNNKSTVLFLPPATDSDIYKPIKMNKTCDFLFLGHIPDKWSKKELHRVVGIENGHMITFKDLLPTLELYFKNPKHRIDSVYCVEYLRERNIILNTSIDKVLTYDLFERTARYIRRKSYVNLFANKNEYKLKIFGTANWMRYDQFSDSYNGYIEDPIMINKELSKSNVLLHDSVYPQFRVFDAMAAKCCVAAPPSHVLDPTAWKDINLNKNEDYIEVDYTSKKMKFDIFKNQSKLKDIKEKAYKKVLQEHLWVHRAEKVLRDVQKFL